MRVILDYIRPYRHIRSVVLQNEQAVGTEGIIVARNEAKVRNTRSLQLAREICALLTWAIVTLVLAEVL